jgi:choline-glycine betaine transporter
MNPVRGVVMLVAAAFAVWEGWKIHSGPHAWTAYGLAALALGMAAWHFTRNAADGRQRRSPRPNL